MLLYDRNIIGSSSEIFGYLRKSSAICGSFWKMFENVCLAFRQLLENLRKSSESVWKSSENRQKQEQRDMSAFLLRTYFIVYGF